MIRETFLCWQTLPPALLSSCIRRFWVQRPQNDRSTQHGSDISAMLFLFARMWAAEQPRLFIVKVSSDGAGPRGGIQRRVGFLGLAVIAEHSFQQSHYIKAHFVYIILHKACSLWPQEAEQPSVSYISLGFKKSSWLILAFIVILPGTVKLNVMAFDMGNG